MRFLILSLFIILTSCIDNSKEITQAKSELDNKQDSILNQLEIKSIRTVLIKQQECWNNGDLEGFMKGYWNSDKLIFTSLNHKPAYGWDNTLKRYKESYPDVSSMGEFKFQILDIELSSKKTAYVKGEWELIRIEDKPNGLFWLNLEKFDNNWLITKDSTISYHQYL